MECAVCGKEIKAGVGIGGVLLCRNTCAEDVRAEMEKQRRENPTKPVSAAGIARQMYRERQGTLDQYSLRDIPGDLWKRAKLRALDEGTDLRAVILKALEQYLA